MTADEITSEVLAKGTIVREPLRPEDGGHPPPLRLRRTTKGCWVGAPGGFYDNGLFYLSYRIRRPRPERGAEVRIACSSDGAKFEDILSIKKEAFGTPSIERCAMCRGPDGWWHFFLSYVDPTDGRWCISALEAPSIERFEPKRAKRLFSAPDIGLEAVKDPWLFYHEGLFYMFSSVAIATPQTCDESHKTADIYNTGECISATGLATSKDLDDWTWQGVVFRPAAENWDGYCRRITSAVYHGGEFLGFYDGSSSRAENYEERTGLAASADLVNWRSLSADGPALVSLHGSGSLRYIDARIIDGEVSMYYEYARADGSHDLRVFRAPTKSLSGLFGKPTD